LKKILRKHLIKKRRNRYIDIEASHLEKICNFLKKKHKKVKIIGGYIPINYEYDCLSLLKSLEKKNYVICLPVIRNNSKMDFYKHSFNNPLKINKLGIPEPVLCFKKILPDLIFVPLVGYDHNLNRLGYGGGFYDRYFEKNSRLKNILKIGLAFSFQKIKQLPTNKFDKKLSRIITEKKI
tara:strand:- start:80 stop:619 length:540 start_codon:yes stop_codon:yes gene_type:complete